MSAAATLHASCVVVGEAGLVIRGASGSGKSSLARQIVREGERGGLFARLVCDDRVRLESRNGRVVASPVAAIAGRIEVRGIGLVTVPFERAAIVRWVVDLSEDPPRLPEPTEATVPLCGVAVPRLQAAIEPGLAEAVLLRMHHPVTP
ncbi:MAG TPA: HPr kinase/phosphatase C-terminal domain-containing protein [Beijerinckiaceae bacterium]|jgi:HPr kinase/phosphorylase|nr:HPr kinase/phosphatase C-terminal domain-containing protein [Beijerinckiaceae bacterium]